MDGLEAALEYLCQKDHHHTSAVDLTGTIWKSQSLPDRLRTLLEKFTSITHLDLSNVGLSTLDNFPTLPNLETLILCNNQLVGSLNHLNNTTVPSLRHINLSGNTIRNMTELKYLTCHTHLETLILKGCFVTNTPDYVITLFDMIPSLKNLDGWRWWVLIKLHHRWNIRDGKKISISEDKGKNGISKGAMSPSTNNSAGRSHKHRRAWTPPPQKGKLFTLVNCRDTFLSMNHNGNHLNVETNNAAIESNLSDMGDLTDGELPLMNEEEGIQAEFLETVTTTEDQQITNMGRQSDAEESSAEEDPKEEEETESPVAPTDQQAEDETEDSEEDDDFQPSESDEEPTVSAALEESSEAEGSHTEEQEETVESAAKRQKREDETGTKE
ncbi:microtubule binding protein [Planoprotostelium fungivorum]|uniref:Microtubule binding protein n=1 Tax=Planoprotostelium fungivorum TaxID=1890364 RepID=A0A2P6NAR8_9EUKA|nr:microtubule binding protein [Planoprotostelium fungivorum]